MGISLVLSMKRIAFLLLASYAATVPTAWAEQVPLWEAGAGAAVLDFPQ